MTRIHPILLILIAAALCTPAIGTLPQTTGTPVTQQTATRVAATFLQIHNIQATTDTPLLITDYATSLFYLITLHPTGYILVTADTRLPPVLAYSHTSSFTCTSDPDYTLLSLARTDILSRIQDLPNLDLTTLQERTDQWTALADGSAALPSTFRQWPRTDTTAYGGWLETTWTQNAPYNDLCPIDLATHERSVAGCPAVAMAQILNYHQTTNHIAFNDSDDYLHDYAGNRYIIDDDFATYDFPSFPELNADLDNLTTHYRTQTPLTATDEAALVFACGVAAQQVYNPQGSGTYSVSQALQAYHRFGFTNASLLTQNTTDTYTQLQDDLKLGLPAHLAVVTPDWTAGHNLVVDGYNTDGYYHCNFGWGGSYDGWYLLPQELPYSLTVLEGVIVHIRSDYDHSRLTATTALNWDHIKKKSTLSGTITLQATADPGTLIPWEITDIPSWGTWTFSATNGTITAGTPQTITVTATAPSQRNHHYAGHISIINPQDPSDYCLVHLSVTTPLVYPGLTARFPRLAALLHFFFPED